MTQIGLLSDTHAHSDEKLIRFFKNCDELWHAGDIGNVKVLNMLETIAPVKAVYGNIDGAELRSFLPEHQRFTIEGMDVWMTHIGGYPDRYDQRVKPEIFHNPPDLFISGHSHILKVINDKKLGLLHINPGAYGKHGLHVVRTAMRFKLHNARISDLEIYELKR
jgi:uncharacterized protein